MIYFMFIALLLGHQIHLRNVQYLSDREVVKNGAGQALFCVNIRTSEFFFKCIVDGPEGIL